jgi:hypothetical protein
MNTEANTLRAELLNMGVSQQIIAGIRDMATLRAVHRHELTHHRANLEARLDRLSAEQVYAELMAEAA